MVQLKIPSNSSKPEVWLGDSKFIHIHFCPCGRGLRGSPLRLPTTSL
uniref:Uncharacterized protein n=1 Tax=Anguilla anguilla TaxID=7936 RepID=A0A0E9QF29_ANGAN